MEDTPKLNILDLPDEVLEEIFMRASYEDLGHFRWVCTRFDQVGKRVIKKGINRVSDLVVQYKSLVHTLCKPDRHVQRTVQWFAGVMSASNLESILQNAILTVRKLNCCCCFLGEVLDEILKIFSQAEFGQDASRMTHQTAVDVISRVIKPLSMNKTTCIYSEKRSPCSPLYDDDQFNMAFMLAENLVCDNVVNKKRKRTSDKVRNSPNSQKQGVNIKKAVPATSRSKRTNTHLEKSNGVIGTKRKKKDKEAQAIDIMKVNEVCQTMSDDDDLMIIEPECTESTKKETDQSEVRNGHIFPVSSHSSPSSVFKGPKQVTTTEQMDQTFKTRRKYIVNNAPHVAAIQKRYPLLFNVKEVLLEYNRVKGDVNYETYKNNLERYSYVIIENVPSSSSSSIYQTVQKKLQEVKSEDEMKYMKSAAAIFLLPMYLDRDIRKFLTFAEDAKSVYPIIACNKPLEEALNKEAKFTILVEMKKLCSCKNFIEAFFAYLASFHIFNIQYAPYCIEIAALVESLLIETAPEYWSDKVNDIKNLLVSLHERNPS